MLTCRAGVANGDLVTLRHCLLQIKVAFVILPGVKNVRGVAWIFRIILGFGDYLAQGWLILAWVRDKQCALPEGDKLSLFEFSKFVWERVGQTNMPTGSRD